MRLPSRTPKSLALFAVTPLVAAAALTFGVALPAQAVDLPTAISDVYVTLPGAAEGSAVTPVQGTQVETHVHIEVPSGAKSGDTFTLQLSDHLKNLPAAFDVDVPGTTQVMAEAAVSQSSPSIVTFTLEPYVDTHLDVVGDAFIDSDFESTTTPSGVSTPFTFTRGDGTTFTTDVTPSGAVQPAGVATGYGVFTRADNGRTNPADFLTYNADTGAAGFDSAQTTVTVPTTQTAQNTALTSFACVGTTPVPLQFQSGTLDGNGNLANLTTVTPTSFSCTADTVTVNWPAAPAGTEYRVIVPVNEVTAPNGIGTPALTYAATAVTTSTVAGTPTTVSTPMLNRQSSAGGTGSGRDYTDALTVAKGDTAGNAGDTAGTAAVISSAGTASLVIAVKNTGTDALSGISVTDAVLANGTTSGLSCDFSALGGPATGTTWAGPLAAGATFDCTAALSGVATGADHEDMATVTATGVLTGTAVSVSNAYFAHPAAATVVPATADGPTTSELAFTGSTDTLPLAGAAGLLLLLGGGLLTAATIQRARRRDGR